MKRGKFNKRFSTSAIQYILFLALWNEGFHPSYRLLGTQYFPRDTFHYSQYQEIQAKENSRGVIFFLKQFFVWYEIILYFEN